MYLVIGANGFLGSYIIQNIIGKSKEKVIATARDLSGLSDNGQVKWTKVDVTNDEDINTLKNITMDNSDVKVIYLAAYHQPDLVQKNPRVAWNVNIISLAKVLNALENVKCFFYSSTDSVYGESIDGYHYKEEDCLKPENTYGIQKKTAESLVQGSGYNVVRFPFLIGKSILEHKKHFYDKILETISKGESFEMFSDSYRSALDFDSAAAILVSLIETYSFDYPKLINISGDLDLSKYDIGVMLAKKYGINTKLITPISIGSTSNIFEAPRANNTLMDNSLIKSILDLKSINIKL